MKLFKITALVGGIVLILFPVLSAQDKGAYKIGPGDVLEISFWQDSNLDTQVRVTQDGKITLDIVGELDAAGQTTSDLEGTIVRRMGRYNKAISQAVVRVLEYNYNRVFVTGQAVSPGKLTFEQIPDLWTIINEAGGITELGDLTRVRIIRGGKDAGQVEVVNVSAMVAAGKSNKLPEIKRDDTIDIPRSFSNLPAEGVSDTTTYRNVFYVIGAVQSAGPQRLENRLDLLEAISLANGHLETADLKDVKVVSEDGGRTQVTHFNMQDYIQLPYPSKYFVQAEDIIYVPYTPDPRRRGFMGLNMTEWLGILGGVGSFILIADQLGVINISN